TLAQALTEDTAIAAASQRQALALYRDLGDTRGQGDALHSLSLVRQMAGDYPASADAARQALDLYRQAGDRVGQGDALNQLASRNYWPTTTPPPPPRNRPWTCSATWTTSSAKAQRLKPWASRSCRPAGTRRPRPASGTPSS